MADLRRLRRPVARALHEALVPLVAFAAVLGVALPSAAHALRPWVPVMLAGQVAGVALTIPADELAPVLRRPRVLLVALGVQWAAMPAFGYLLLRLSGGDLAGQGAFIAAVAPAEITSALVGVLAGAQAATAATLMTASVGLGCILTPIWLLALPSTGGHVDRWSLVSELVLSVAVPLLLGVALRSRSRAVARRPRRCLDLAGISLVLVVFVGAGAARPLLLSADIGEAAALALALIAWGISLGAAVGVLTPAVRSIKLAVAFPVGMREFGIATAVALAVAPGAAGFGGLYGVLLMIASATLATITRRRGDAPSAPSR